MRKLRSAIAVVLFRIAAAIAWVARYVRPNVDEAEYVRMVTPVKHVEAALKKTKIPGRAEVVGTIEVGSPLRRSGAAVKIAEMIQEEIEKKAPEPDYELKVVDPFEEDISKAIEAALKDEVREEKEPEEDEE